MIDFLKQGICGGLSQVCYGKGTAENKYTGNDKGPNSKYLLYLDFMIFGG